MSDPSAVPTPSCPKCSAALPPNAIACPQCGAQVAQAKPDLITLTLGQKIAAVVFILNGLSLIAELFLTKGADASQSGRSALISIVIGGYLFSNKASALKWAKIATVLGGIVYTILAVVQGDVYSAVIQVLFSLSLAGLLFGTAGKFRLALCGFVVLCYFGVEAFGLYLTAHPDATTQTEAPAATGTPVPAATPTP